MRLSGNTILITGGTSGIGRGLAEAFHLRGNRVIIAGRRQAALNEIIAAHPGIRGIQVDVEDSRAVDACAATIQEEFPGLNVLVNNAGIAGAEDFTTESIDVSVPRSIIQTNIVGAIQLTARLLPVLNRQPSATIIATSSGLAFVPRSNFPTYCATKAFLHSWLQSLRFQLRGTSVEVLELAPPYVQTELGGPDYASDPAPKPLADYIAEVLQVLGNVKPPRSEILVERVKALRWAERDGVYEQVFAALNSE